MGQIYQAVKLRELLTRFNIKNFVETGTGIGDTLTELLVNQVQPMKIYTVELMDELHQNLLEKFSGINYIEFIKGYSHEEVPKIMKRLSDEPTLFWHDAHFPGADFGINGATYETEKDPVKRIPLQQELEAIKNSKRDISKDVIIMDDLYVYKDNVAEHGNWPWRQLLGGDGIDFVYDLFSDTHFIFETSRHQGFIILLPKLGFVESDKDLIR